MKRKSRALKLHKETLRQLDSEDFGWVAGGGLRSVKADCLTEQAYCNTDNPSCPGNCLTDRCNTRTLC